ncbi:unnamed protein product [Peniophora sp. CBMAI 1063]|nr:unnamed protein product [Peniophora sp. CBMAI 1063]
MAPTPWTVAGLESQQAYAFAHSQLLPNLFLETVGIGLFSGALLLSTYQTLRPGLLPQTVHARDRIARLTAFLVLWILFVIHWTYSLKSTRALLFGEWLQSQSVSITEWDGLVLFDNLEPIVLECFLFGIFCTQTAVAIYIFVRRNLRMRSHQILLATTLSMFAVSLIHLTIQMLQVFEAYNSAEALFEIPRFGVGLKYAPVMLVTINVVLGDAIVLWRMCVLWQQNAFTRILALVLLAGTFITSVANLAQEFARPEVSHDVLEYDVASLSDFTYGTAVLALSLLTNLVATLVIGWRAWLYRKSIVQHLATFNRYSIVEKVMSLLIESGTIYCIIWTLYIVDSRSSVFDPSRALQAAQLASRFYTGGAAYFSRIMPQVTGMYPAMILVIVALEQSYFENAFSESKLSSFVAGRPRSARHTTRSAASNTEDIRSFARMALAPVAIPAITITDFSSVEAGRPQLVLSVGKAPIQSTKRATTAEAGELESVHSTRSESMRERYSMYPASVRHCMTMPASIPHQPRPVRISAAMSVTSSGPIISPLSRQFRVQASKEGDIPGRC